MGAQPLIQLGQPLELLLFDLAGRDLRPHLDHAGDVLHGQLRHTLGADGVQLLRHPQLLAAQLRDALIPPVKLLLGELLAVRRLRRHQALPLEGQIFQLALQLHPPVDLRVVEVPVGARLVDQVDGLVRQIAVGDIPLRQHHRLPQHPLRDGHAVELLVVVSDTLQYLQRILHIRFVHRHRLEPALQRRVLLDMLAVLVERGGTDDLYLAPAEGGLEDVGGVHAALGVPCAHDVVYLVNDEDHIPGLADLLDQPLHSALELSPELGTRHQRRQIKKIDLLVPQLEGHLARRDALRQPLGDGGLAHARLTDQAGVVLLAAVQDLHHPLDLLLPADHGVQLALPGALAQVDAVVVQEFPLFLRLAPGGLLSRSAAALGRLLLGRGIGIVVEQAVQERERGGLAALLVVLVPLVIHRVQLLCAAEGLHHLAVDVLQILRRDAHPLHHVLHLRQPQLGGALQAESLVDHLVFLVHPGDEHHSHVFLTFGTKSRLHGFPPLSLIRYIMYVL